MKLPELKRRFKNKYVIRIAAGVLTIAVAGGSAGVYTVNAAKTSTKAETTQESTDKKDKKDNKDDEEDLKEVLSSKISKAADEEVGKEETVYVVADNSEYNTFCHGNTKVKTKGKTHEAECYESCYGCDGTSDNGC